MYKILFVVLLALVLVESRPKRSNAAVMEYFITKRVLFHLVEAVRKQKRSLNQLRYDLYRMEQECCCSCQTGTGAGNESDSDVLDFGSGSGNGNTISEEFGTGPRYNQAEIIDLLKSLTDEA